MTDDEIMAAIVQERGYLVTHTEGSFRVGEITNKVTRASADDVVPYPFRVIAVTDAQDFQAQLDVIARLIGNTSQSCGRICSRFYRVITD